MPRIIADPISFSTHHLHLCFRPTDAVLSSGTGFIYQSKDALYLITNWHNVSGRNPIDGKCLSENLAVPDLLSTVFRSKENAAVWARERIPLYLDDAMNEPTWFIHPVHKSNVDVVAIRLSAEISEKYQLYPINRIEFDSQFKVSVADDAFVIGYPFSESPELQFPIWKRASIASEPDIDIGKLPKMLVDTATRPGLSGSPVVMQRSGVHGRENGQLKGDEIIGTIRNFIGIYSGRVGADESKAQLGVVWKAGVIDEIIAGQHTEPPTPQA